MARLIHAYMEIASPRRGAAVSTYLSAIEALRHSRFGGHAVLGVAIIPNGIPYHVPDFGHNADCPCQEPEPHGVDRYFGVSIVLDSEPTADVLGTYWLLRDVACIEMCGLHIPKTELVDRETVEAKL
jgi:hypothetical protein